MTKEQLREELAQQETKLDNALNKLGWGHSVNSVEINTQRVIEALDRIRVLQELLDDDDLIDNVLSVSILKELGA